MGKAELTIEAINNPSQPELQFEIKGLTEEQLHRVEHAFDNMFDMMSQPARFTASNTAGRASSFSSQLMSGDEAKMFFGALTAFIEFESPVIMKQNIQRETARLIAMQGTQK